MRNQGEQVETLWESGKTIRHLTVISDFKIKQEIKSKLLYLSPRGNSVNDETRHESKRKS